MKTHVLGDAVQSALERFGYLGIIRSIILLIILAGVLFWLIRQNGNK